MIKEAERVQIEGAVEQCVPPSGDPSYADQVIILKLVLSKHGHDVYRDLLRQDISPFMENSDSSNNHV